MENHEKKGITVKIDAELHAEVRQYIEGHSMTMAEFVTLALQDELHPQNQMKEGKNMENMRTLAFQVPENLFQRIKEYLQRNHMTQKEFMLRLIEEELERDLREHEDVQESLEIQEESIEETEHIESQEAAEDSEDVEEDIAEDEVESEDMGLSMGMQGGM